MEGSKRLRATGPAKPTGASEGRGKQSTACTALDTIWASLPARDRNEFKQHALLLFMGQDGEDATHDPHEVSEASVQWQQALRRVQQIAEQLRDVVPDISGSSPGEEVRFPDPGQTGAFNGCTAENSVFVDGFLYDDDAVDALCSQEPPRLSRCFCPDTTRPKE